ncbi:MAG: hypothetical protein JW757_09350 [Anaerolineales bacterium]|nr:hypothetical protein [Anaerolineales bacterium]
MGDEVRKAFWRLAALVNGLTAEEQSELKFALGEYTHDLKHTLGLVTGANALISRTAAGQAKIDEMTRMIEGAARQLDQLTDLMVEELNNRIGVDD